MLEHHPGTVDVKHHGRTYRASYLVVDGMLQASLGTRTFFTPVQVNSPEDVVRSLVVARLEQQDRRMRLKLAWDEWKEKRQQSSLRPSRTGRNHQ